jgi:two-component system sensor histidine kinase DesK
MRTNDPAERQGISGLQRLVWSGVWLVFLAYPIADIFSRDHTDAWIVAAWLTLALFVALYLRTMWLALGADLRGPRPNVSPWLCALIVVALAAFAGFGAAWSGLVIYLGVATGATLANRAAMITLAFILGASAIIGVAVGLDASDLAFGLFLTAALGVTMLGARRMFELINELRDARDEIARLTVAEQRARFARDLHDVLGHNLSVIALKSQVARRTSESDPEAAAAALRDVEAVARESLNDVRELVAGYRQRSLDDELTVAKELLQAAGVTTRIDRPDELPLGAADEPLAWVLREGTTNVLRHSAAEHCWITLATWDGVASLEILDDGAPGDARSDGSGLRGLRERLAEAGGELHAGPRPGGGFCLMAKVPA